MLSVAARAACVRFAAGASVVTAAHETDAAHCEALRRKMTPIGAFSLLSETPAAPSIPAVLLTFKAPLAAADLRDALTAGVAPASARFRSRVDERALEFVDDLGPAAAPFVVERGARGEAALPGAVAEALTAPLLGRDGAGPWWEALVFDHAARTSVLLRAHHCLADGVSLASLFARATDQAEAIAAAVDAEIAKRRRPGGERRRRSALARFAGALLKALGFVARVARGALAMLRVVATTRAPLRGAAPRRAATGRSVAWASKFSDVATLKRVAKALGGDAATVNDLFAAIVGGALRDVLGDATHVTCAVPVHLYGGALLPGVDVGNHIGAVLATLPLPGGDGAAAHVARVSRDVGGALRGGAGALVAYGAAYVAAAVLPRWLVPYALGGSAGCATVALTNVRGPPVDGLSIRGVPVETVVPFLPPPPGVPLGVALATVGPDATISFNADAALLDADALLAAALAYYGELERAAGI